MTTNEPGFESSFQREIALLDQRNFEAVQKMLSAEHIPPICQTAFDIAIAARSRLIEMGFEIETLDKIVATPNVEDVPIDIEGMQFLFNALREIIVKNDSILHPCPSCGGQGKRISKAPFMTHNPQASLYFELDEIFGQAPNLKNISDSII